MKISLAIFLVSLLVLLTLIPNGSTSASSKVYVQIAQASESKFDGRYFGLRECDENSDWEFFINVKDHQFSMSNGPSDEKFEGEIDENGNVAVEGTAFYFSGQLRDYSEGRIWYSGKLEDGVFEMRGQRGNKYCYLSLYPVSADSEIIVAAHEGDVGKLIQLVKEGANINATDDSGLTPLIKASIKGHVPVVSELIAKSANLNAKDNEKKTAIHWAAGMNNIKVIKMLVKAGADLNATDEYGDTALISAIKSRYRNVVRYLVSAGADRSIKNGDQLDAFMIAKKNRQRVIQEILKSK